MTPWTQPIRDASAWTAANLERDRSWVYVLSARQQAELEATLRGVQQRGLALARITRDEFPLPGLRATLRDLQSQLRDGGGFALLRGIPVTGRSLDELANLSGGLGTYLGTAVTQNSEAGLIRYVTDSCAQGRARAASATRARWGCTWIWRTASDCSASARPRMIWPAWRPVQ